MSLSLSVGFLELSSALPEMEGFARLAAIRQYVLSGCKVHQPGATKLEKSAIARAAKNYVFHDNRLYYLWQGSRRLVLFSPEERDRALYECHDQAASGGHCGVRRTAEKVVARYYWFSIKQDVEAWVASCEKCQRHDAMKTVVPTLHPIKVEGPWQVVGVDIIGPLAKTSTNYTHILTMTDLFTKWVMARPLTGSKAPEVALKVTETLLAQGGAKKIITDRGREFVNAVSLFLELTEIFYDICVQYKD